MSATRIKEKLSKIVKGQLPSFIQEDYETFVSFIEAYYSFLEQDQGAYELIQNLSSYNDLDETIPSFLEYFLNTYAPQIPSNIKVDQKLLIKKIKYLYESKGSEASFELLFKILYDTDVTVEYPNNFTLIPSDGRWSQKVAIQLRTVFGDRTKIKDRFLKYTFEGQNYTIPIVDVRFLTETDTEVFLDQVFLPPNFNVGDTVEVRTVNTSGDLIFVGLVEPIPTTYEIIIPGSKFFPGQVYTIGLDGGFGTVIEIIEVDNNSGIKTLRFVRFGQNYSTSAGTIFTLPFDPTKNIPGSLASLIKSSTRGSRSSGIVQHLFNDSNIYFSEDYVSSGDYNLSSVEIPFNFSLFNDRRDTFVLSDDTAIITFKFGSIARYPGEFTTPNGFVSEPIVNLQNANRFQPFAYQTNTEQDIDEFFDIVKETIHPAGQLLFNNREIKTSIDLSGNVRVEVIQNVFFEAISTFAVSDDVTLTFLIPQTSDSIVVVLADKPAFNISANKFEDVKVIENTEKDISLLKDSNTVIFDQINILQNQFSDAFGEFDSIEKIDIFKLADPDEIQPTEFAAFNLDIARDDSFELESNISATITINQFDVEKLDDNTTVDSNLEKQDVISEIDSIEELDVLKSVEPDEINTSEFAAFNLDIARDDSFELESNISATITINQFDAFDIDDNTTVNPNLVKQDAFELDDNSTLSYEPEFEDNLEATSVSNLNITSSIVDVEKLDDNATVNPNLVKQDAFELDDSSTLSYEPEFEDNLEATSVSNLNITSSIVDAFDLDDVTTVNPNLVKQDAISKIDSIEELDVLKLVDPDEIQPTEFAAFSLDVARDDSFELDSETNIEVVSSIEDSEFIIAKIDTIDVHLEKQHIVDVKEDISTNYSTIFDSSLSTNSDSNLNITSSTSDFVGFEDITIVGFLVERTFDDVVIIEEDLGYEIYKDNLDNVLQSDFTTIIQVVFNEDIFKLTSDIINIEITNIFEDVIETKEDVSVEVSVDAIEDIVKGDEKSFISYNPEFDNKSIVDSESNLNIIASFVDTLDLSELISATLLTEFDEVLATVDSVDNLEVLKYVDIDNIEIEEFSNNNVTLNIDDNINVESKTSIDLDIVVSDTERILEQLSIQYQLNQTNQTFIQENSNNLIILNVENTFVLGSQTLLDLDVFVSDAEKILEQTSIEYETNINNSLPPSSDNATGFLTNYAEEYFQELYDGEIIFNT
jgi:hypothetical protein